MTRTLRTFTLAAAAFACWAAAQTALGEDAGNAARGRATYNLYCSSCHGKTAKGDGPVAPTLKVAPPDLTLLARANAGIFPTERVIARVDGRDPVAAHGPSDMPVWGMSFNDPGKDTNQEPAVQARIRDIVAFVESQQVKGEDAKPR